MSKQKRNVILVLALLFIAVLFTFTKSFFLSSFLSLKWHLTNDNKVVLKDLDFELPMHWWVVSATEDRLGLSRISLSKDMFGPIFVSKKTLSDEDLLKFHKNKEVGGVKITPKGDITSFKLSGEDIFAIEYAVVEPSNLKGKLYWTLTIPSRGIVVNAFEINPEDKSIIVRELIKNIVDSDN